jgi:prepilin-type N-terminal cleavage/methylation domain-containing protein
MRAGFSLVELSIVLVILGLLTGGILTGQSLIRAAELRSVTTEFKNYQTAVMTFKDKYFAIPGDMRNATDFWGSAGGSGTIGDGCETATGAGTQTCNGNGAGDIADAAAIDEYGERFTFWQHLANAGLIEGSYTGISGSANQYEHIPGTNHPVSRFGNAGWTAFDSSVQATITGNQNVFDGNYRKQISIGQLGSGGMPDGAILKPEELWGIDTKIDDGMPATGKVVVRARVNCAVAVDGSALTTGAADAAKLDSIYNLTSTSNDCAIIFRQSY